MPEEENPRSSLRDILGAGRAPLPGHSDEPPKGIFTMAVSILWGVLAFACGFESVVSFNAWMASRSLQDAVISVIDLVLCFALGALAVTLWKRKEWLPQRVSASAKAVAANPVVWVAVVLVMLVISARNQPQLSADDIAKAVAAQLRGSPSTPAPAATVPQNMPPTLPQKPYPQIDREHLAKIFSDLSDMFAQNGINGTNHAYPVDT